MSIVIKIKELCASKGTTMTALERELNFGKGIIRRWDEASPNSDKLQKVADYFHVSVDYLLGREEKMNVFTEQDEKDIAKTMAKIKNQLTTQQSLMFDGEILDDETAKLLLDAIEQQERMVKAINKKYTPKKYR